MITELLVANSSVNFATCIYVALHQEFLGIVVDITGVRPLVSNISATLKIPRPTGIEELRHFLGMTAECRGWKRLCMHGLV